MTPKVIVAAIDEPLTIEECRQHLEAQSYGDSDVDPTDDAMIEGLLAAAREHCENFTGLSMATRTLEIALNEFPDDGESIELPMGPVRDVLSISWGDESDDELGDVDVTLDDYSKPSKITPITGSWPAVTAATNVIKIRYLAGYGVDTDGGEELPKVLRSAILLMLGHLYANREDTAEKAPSSIPNGAEALMRPLRVRLGMA
jgi:uncharacterized phiE125 gp8 family phage protein